MLGVKVAKRLEQVRLCCGPGTGLRCCSMQAINSALYGTDSDELPSFMSYHLHSYIIIANDKMSYTNRNSQRWKDLLVRAVDVEHTEQHQLITHRWTGELLREFKTEFKTVDKIKRLIDQMLECWDDDEKLLGVASKAYGSPLSVIESELVNYGLQKTVRGLWNYIVPGLFDPFPVMEDLCRTTLKT